MKQGTGYKDKLVAVIKGLRLEEGFTLKELLKKPPSYYEKVGLDFLRLAEIGMREINRVDQVRHESGEDFQKEKRKLIMQILLEPEDQPDYRINITKLIDDFENLVRHNQDEIRDKGKKNGKIFGIFGKQ
jgi:hypothetical protein